MNSIILTAAFCIASLGFQIPAFGEDVSTFGPMTIPVQAHGGAWSINSASICFPHGAPTPVDMDFGPYMGYVQRKIKQSWLPVQGTRSHSLALAVVFEIERGGDLTHLRISKSCSAAVDESISKAIRKMGSLKPLPVGAPESIEVQFTFDYQNRERAKRKIAD